MVLGRSLVPGRSLDPVGRPSREHRSRASFRLLALLAVGALLGPAAAAAFELPPSQPGVYVYDFAHVWQPATVRQAQATVEAIRERTGAEIAIVSVPTGLSSVSTEMARVDARTIMDTWGVGRAGVNDGLVILFDLDTSLRHGQIYLYTGSGFRDGYLSDDEVQAIVDNDMLPNAKEGDLDGALLAGLAGVDRAVQPGGNPARATKAILDLLLGGVIVGAALLVLGLFLRTWWLRGRDAQVPLIDDSVLLPEPPRRLTPALATVLRNDGVDRDAFTAALVDLGHRGLITFRERDSFLGLNKRVDLVVPHRPLDDFASEDARRRPLGAPEQNLLRTITTHKGSDGVLSSERLKKGLGKSFYDTFRRQLGRAAQDSGWFRDDPTKLTSRRTSASGWPSPLAWRSSSSSSISRGEGSWYCPSSVRVSSQARSSSSAGSSPRARPTARRRLPWPSPIATPCAMRWRPPTRSIGPSRRRAAGCPGSRRRTS